MPVPLHSVQRLADNKSFAPVPNAIGEPGRSWVSPAKKDEAGTFINGQEGRLPGLAISGSALGRLEHLSKLPDADFGGVRGYTSTSSPLYVHVNGAHFDVKPTYEDPLPPCRGREARAASILAGGDFAAQLLEKIEDEADLVDR